MPQNVCFTFQTKHGSRVSPIALVAQIRTVRSSPPPMPILFRSVPLNQWPAREEPGNANVGLQKAQVVALPPDARGHHPPWKRVQVERGLLWYSFQHKDEGKEQNDNKKDGIIPPQRIHESALGVGETVAAILVTIVAVVPPPNRPKKVIVCLLEIQLKVANLPPTYRFWQTSQPCSERRTFLLVVSILEAFVVRGLYGVIGRVVSYSTGRKTY